MTDYRLESTDPDTGVRERMSLSASNDAQAVEQMEAVRWRHENAGERRTLALHRPEPDGWTEIGRAESRRAKGRRSWIAVSTLDDGRERRDVVNADTAEDAARIASLGADVVEVVSVERRTPRL